MGVLDWLIGSQSLIQGRKKMLSNGGTDLMGGPTRGPEGMLSQEYIFMCMF